VIVAFIAAMLLQTSSAVQIQEIISGVINIIAVAVESRAIPAR
jgi:hypothetical protein